VKNAHYSFSSDANLTVPSLAIYCLTSKKTQLVKPKTEKIKPCPTRIEKLNYQYIIKKKSAFQTIKLLRVKQLFKKKHHNCL